MTAAATWTPSGALVADVRRSLACAPRTTADDRFEADAWRALLDAEGALILTRLAAPSHVTASAAVLAPDGRRTCLVLHGRVGLWMQPGGHLEADDGSLTGACAREVLEETGLAGEVIPEPVALSRHRAPCRGPGVDWHLDVQHLLVSPVLPPVVSPESRDVAWFDVDDLPADVAPGVATLVHRAAAILRG